MKTTSAPVCINEHRPLFLKAIFMNAKPLPLLAIVFMAIFQVHAGDYFQDFSAFSVGATSFGDGSTFSSDQSSSVAGVIDGTYKELGLTANGTGNTHSAFLLPDLDPGTPVYAFSAKWNSQVNGNFPNAADGFSFNFGQVGSLNLISSSYFQESGFGTGICFSVQNYVNNNPGFYLRVNGATIASQSYSPGLQWGTNNSTRHFFEVDWNYASGVSVSVDGQVIFTNVPTPGLTFQAGNRFAWAARCGAVTEEVRLDNIVVVTGGNLVQVPMSSPYFSDTNTVQTAANAFDGNNNTVWEDFYNISTSPLGVVGATAPPGTAVTAYALVVPYGTDHLAGPQSAPAGWVLEGSNNGSTWIPCGTGSGHFLNALETRCWLATNSTAYSDYELNVTTQNGYVGLGLAELRFYKLNAVSGAYGWYQSSLSGNGFWTSVVCSSNGMRLAAVADGGNIYLSTNFGSSWSTSTAPAGFYGQIVSSADGSNYFATVPNSTKAELSFDYGATWVQRAVPANDWTAAACSENGTIIFTAGDNLIGGAISTSIGISRNSGSSWTQVENGSGAFGWYAIACSGDGTKVAAATFGSDGADGAGISLSSNAGVSWTRSSAPHLSWSGISCSLNGSKLAAVSDHAVYYSTDSGNTWNQGSNAPSDGWNCIASSSDGSKLVASGADGTYFSTDFGATWTQSLNQSFVSVASSWDGARLAGLVFNGSLWLYGPINPQAPLAATLPANSVGNTTARLNGQGTPDYLPTSVWFQWGKTTAYGNSTPAQSIGNGNASVSVSATLARLSLATTYHFRAVALNSLGTNFGADMSFTTPSNSFFSLPQPGDTLIASSTNSPSNQPATDAIDGTVSTKYLNFDITNAGFTIFPSITNYPVQALGLISAEDAPERDPASFELYGSPDGTNFTLIASNSVPLFAARNAIQSIAFANTNTYAAYKIIFPTVANPAIADSMQIAEVELLPFGDIASTNDTLSVSLPAGASVGNTTPVGALLDRQLNQDANKMDVLNDSGNVVALITPAAGPSIVKGFELIGGDDDASYPGREPSFFTLEGSNNGTNFVSLASVTPVVPSANMQIQGFSVLNNTNTYKLYRATFGPPQSDTVLQIGELRLFGVTSPRLDLSAVGGNLLLSWPATGFTVQQSSNMTTWVAATNAITVTNGRSQLSIPGPVARDFYRLKSQ